MAVCMHSGGPELACILVLLASPASAAPGALPRGVEEHCWVAPCALTLHTGDRDGVGTDRAILIRERGGQHRRGIALQSPGGAVVLMGAGHAVGSLGPDLGWIASWHVLTPLGSGARSDTPGALLLCPEPRSAGTQACVVVRWHGEDSWGAGGAYDDDLDAPPQMDAFGLADPRRRFSALRVLRDYQLQPVKHAILPGLGDDDAIVRLQTAAALAPSRIQEVYAVVERWLRPSSTELSPFARAEAVEIVRELNPDGALPLLSRLAVDEDRDVREAAVEALATRTEKADAVEVVAALARAMGDPDARVRLAAIHAARQLRAPAFVPPLIALLRDADVKVRYDAANALGALEARAATRALSESLRDLAKPADGSVCERRTIHGTVACRAAYALGRIGDPAAIPALVASLDSGCAGQVLAGFGALAFEPLAACLRQGAGCGSPRDAFVTLAMLDDPRVDAILAAELARDRVPRGEVLWILQGRHGADALPAVLAELRRGRDDVVPALHAILRATRDRRAVAPLIEFVASTRDSRRQVPALQAMALVPDARAESLLLDVLRRSEPAPAPETARAAAAVLGEIRSKAAVPELLRIAHATKLPEVAASAMQALGRIGDRRVGPEILPFLDGAPAVREAAADALEAIADPALVPGMVDLVKARASANPPSLVGGCDLWGPERAALRALGGAVRGRSVRGRLERLARELFENLVKAPDDPPALAAIDALAALRDPSSVSLLLELAQGDNPRRRRAALGALGDFGDRRATPVLLAALEQPDEWSQAAAMWSLGKLADPQALERIRQIAAQPAGPSVAVNATAALARYPAAQVRGDLERLAERGTFLVAANALAGLARIGDAQARAVLVRLRGKPWAGLVLLRALHLVGGADREAHALAHELATRPGSRGDVGPVAPGGTPLSLAAASILAEKPVPPRARRRNGWFSHRMPARPEWNYVLTAPDGLVKVGRRDMCGSMAEEQLPSGELSLDAQMQGSCDDEACQSVRP